MTVTTVPNVSLSPQVDSLAEQLGVRAELPAIMAMTRHVFPDGKNLSKYISAIPSRRRSDGTTVVPSLRRRDGDGIAPRKTRSCTWTGSKVSMEVEIDPEIANYVKLAVVVRLPSQEIEASVAAYQRWHRELPETCPASLATNFCLGMEFDE